MGACFGKKLDCEAVACHPYRFRNGVLLRLFGLELCPFTARIRIALQHKGIPVEPIWVPPEGVSSNKLELDWLASVCPEGTFPVLQHGNSIIYGSADDILDYVEATFKEPPLIPDGPKGNDVHDWVEYIGNTFTPLIGQALYDLNPYMEQNLAENMESAFVKLDRGIYECSNGGPYFFGQEFCFADVYLIPFLELIRPLQFFRGITIDSSHPHLLSYLKRMIYFPSYSSIRMDPDLLEMSVSKALQERAPPALVSLTMLQHESIMYHLDRVVELSDELALTKVEVTSISPVKAGISIKIKRLGKEYTRLVELMQEHAQMEERTIFPILQEADEGLTATVNADHARDLPVMNGIKEDLKSVMSMQQGTSGYNEALTALATRLRMLQEYTKEHFHEEELELLPLMEAVGMGGKEQEALVAKCVILMESTHGRMLCYLLKGLRPHKIHQYLTIALKSPAAIQKTMMTNIVICADKEFEGVKKVVEERFQSLYQLTNSQHSNSLK